MRFYLFLLYCCENWSLTDSKPTSLGVLSREKLEGEYILKLSLAVRLALKWPSVASQILTRKLSLLAKVSSNDESLGCQIFSALTSNSSYNPVLIQECLSLENKIGCIRISKCILVIVVVCVKYQEKV